MLQEENLNNVPSQNQVNKVRREDQNNKGEEYRKFWKELVAGGEWTKVFQVLDRKNEKQQINSLLEKRNWFS